MGLRNLIWPEANHLTIYNSVRGFDLGTTENKSGQRSGRELNSGPVQRSSKLHGGEY